MRRMIVARSKAAGEVDVAAGVSAPIDPSARAPAVARWQAWVPGEPAVCAAPVRQGGMERAVGVLVGAALRMTKVLATAAPCALLAEPRAALPTSVREAARTLARSDSCRGGQAPT